MIKDNIYAKFTWINNVPKNLCSESTMSGIYLHFAHSTLLEQHVYCIESSIESVPHIIINNT